jgi:single-strand DNA-binding protein
LPQFQALCILEPLYIYGKPTANPSVRLNPARRSMSGNFIRRKNYLQEAFMNNLNSILIEGNLVRDPVLRSTPKGTPVCTFTLASNRFFKQDSGLEKEVGFFEVETWSHLAERCSDYGRKGRGVRVVGRLKQERWNGTDGKQRSRITIVAEHVEFRPEFKKNEETSTNTAASEAAIAAASDAAGGVDMDYQPDFSHSLQAAGVEAPLVEELEAVTF